MLETVILIAKTQVQQRLKLGLKQQATRVIMLNQKATRVVVI